MVFSNDINGGVAIIGNQGFIPQAGQYAACSNICDIAVIIDALHHVPDPFKALAEMRHIARDLILAEPNAINPIRRFNELRFRHEDVREISFYECKIRKQLHELGYQTELKHIHFIPAFTPDKLMGLASTIEAIFEKTPLLNRFGGLFIMARSQ